MVVIWNLTFISDFFMIHIFASDILCQSCGLTAPHVARRTVPYRSGPDALRRPPRPRYPQVATGSWSLGRFTYLSW